MIGKFLREMVPNLSEVRRVDGNGWGTGGRLPVSYVASESLL